MSRPCRHILSMEKEQRSRVRSQLYCIFIPYHQIIISCIGLVWFYGGWFLPLCIVVLLWLKGDKTKNDKREISIFFVLSNCFFSFCPITCWRPSTTTIRPNENMRTLKRYFHAIRWQKSCCRPIFILRGFDSEKGTEFSLSIKNGPFDRDRTTKLNGRSQPHHRF